jgi:hypothetical protein
MFDALDYPVVMFAVLFGRFLVRGVEGSGLYRVC